MASDEDGLFTVRDMESLETHVMIVSSQNRV